MNIRRLNTNDYTHFLSIINDFRQTDFSFTQFKNILNTQTHIEIYIIEKDNKIIGAGTLLFETKFIHNISCYAHIEDIIIKKEYQGSGYGKILIQHLVEVCHNKKCYKILLDCEPQLIPFYEKCGFKNKGNQMVNYLLSSD